MRRELCVLQNETDLRPAPGQKYVKKGTSKLQDEIQPYRIALESIHGGEFMAPLKVQYQDRLHGSHSDLYTCRVNTVMYTGISSIRAGII